MPATKVYFDESGNTGTQLLDPQQPYFSVGSTDIPEAEAEEIIRRCFPRHRGSEIKSKDLLKRPQGQRGFLAFAEEVGRQPERFTATKINKRFSVVAKMVDHLVEPVLYDEGYDFYRDDYARPFANLTYWAIEQLPDRETSTGLLAAYNAFARAPDAPFLAALRSALLSALSKAQGSADLSLGLMLRGTERFNAAELASFKDSNDIHVTSLISAMGHWQGRHAGPFEVFHDESMHFFSRGERWRSMTDPNHPPQVIAMTPTKKLVLPISVVATTEMHSHQCASVQLCDLVAGFVARAFTSKNEEFQSFVQEATEAGIGEMDIFPLDVGSDVVDGLPARADGPDVIDRIRASIAAARRASGDRASP